MYERIIRHISLILRPVGPGVQIFGLITSHACNFQDMWKCRPGPPLVGLKRREEGEEGKKGGGSRREGRSALFPNN